ncbi:chloride channel protein [Acidocella facilis]|uniref:chloride channel protein n=1 Tax=Acidocella facilis TaxID=525 RepID=UPI001F26F6D3|nr:chloride channel protein [Acidocella facilis]
MSGTARHSLKLALVTVLVGIAGGIGGGSMALLLHAVQHVTYGYSLRDLVGPESFLTAVAAVPPWHRALALLIAGLVAGLGWWAVYNRGAKLVSIKAAASSGKHMPYGSTTGHALLQIITVAMGSPLGREVAPREIAALLTQRLTGWAGITGEEAKILLGCGAGAGLAAVYNVPLGGAVFALEVLILRLDPRSILMALASSCIAAMLAWSVLGDVPQYHIPDFTLSAPLLVLCVLAAPVIGLAGHGFARLTAAARKNMRTDGRLIRRCLVVFTLIGLAAMAFPQLPGNGKGPIQLGLESALPLHLALALLGLKVAAIAGALWAGAEGGVLTPGLTVGALLSTLLVLGWNLVLPAVPAGAFALVGAAAFLGVSMEMPFTAVALMFGFTRVGQDFLVPLILTAALASATSRAVPLVQTALANRRAPAPEGETAI